MTTQDQVRLAMVLANLRPGGAEKQMLMLAKGLPSQGIAVDLLSLVGEGPLDAAARSAGVTIHHVGERPLGGESMLVRAAGRSWKVAGFIRHVRRFRYDVVDAWLYPQDVVAALSRPFTRVPVIVSGRRNLEEHRTFGPASGAVDRLMRSRVDAVVANSDAAGRFAVAHHRVDPGRLRVIRNGVEVVDDLAPADVARLRRSFGVDGSELVIGCVGNYREVKRLDLLIDSFAGIAAAYPGVRLVLVGDGPMRSRLEQQVAASGLSERVRLHGPMLDMTGVYSAFDLVVQSSASEGLPNVVLEAAAAGRPIVATDAGGTNEIVLDGRTGLLVPTGSAAALTQALTRMLDDGDLRRRLGDAARLHVRSAFGVDRLVTEFASLYRALLAERRRR